MLSRRLLCTFVFALSACALAQEEREARLVRTAQGQVRGYKETGDIFVFYGIPYATAPTGPHRFKAPLPPPVWLQPLEAVDTSTVCPQAQEPFSLTKSKTVQENCLVTNVYVPDTNVTKLPVVVYIHGGAYQVGHGNLLTPKNLVKSKKIVAVTFNYRLGAHGFLCLGTVDVPGNAGMKDQVTLLRWVKKNIANFGGNPDDVTIAGYSAGSSAVDLLMLSKSTKGLFNKVIPESGANVAVWSVQQEPLENAKTFAKTLNFTNVDDIFALEEFYKTVSYELLTSDMFLSRKDSSALFSPCVERNTGTEPFLEDTPVNILKQGKYKKIPILYGFASMEGLFRVPLDFIQWKDRMNERFSDFLPADLKFDTEEQKEEVARKIKEFYFGDKTVSENTLLEYIYYFTDIAFAYPTLRSVKLQVEAGNDKIYLYEYSFAQDQELPPTIKQNVRGANHCAQTGAVLDGAWGNSDAVENESILPKNLLKSKSMMRELWLNFMVTGVPVPEGSAMPVWPPAGADCSPHMSLGETLELRGALLQRRTQFWDDIYERHYRAPTPPPPPPSRHSEL